MSKGILKSIKAFASDSSGNVALMMGAAAIPIMMGVGGAIDVGEAYNIRQELSVALDAAVITAAGTYSNFDGKDSDAEAAAIAAAKVHFHAALSHTGLKTPAEPEFRLNAAKDGFIGEVTGTMPTRLLQFAGIGNLDISRESEALFARVEPTGDLEVSVMLDVTGSMCDDGDGPCSGGTKMLALKKAAKELVDRVVWEDQTKYQSRVAIVPFSNRVRVAPDGQAGSLYSKMTGLNTTWSGWQKECVNGYSSGGGGSETGGTWTCTKYQVSYKTNWKAMPCVTDRHYNNGWKFDYTDDAPNTQKYLNAHDGSRSIVSQDSASTPVANNGSSKTKPADQWNYTSDGVCADIDNSNVMQPLSNDKEMLADKIDALKGYGGTGGVLGTAMTWYTLSPNWASVWPGGSIPKNYNLLKQNSPAGKPKLRKVAVLMTDGVYNSYRGWKDQDKAMLSQAAKDMCDAMKKTGIEIYTIGFSLNELGADDKSTSEDVLKSCGSSVSHFYSTLNGTDLVEAFDEIGQKVLAGSSGSIRLVR